MNRNDTIDVLTAIAAFDQRTVGDADVDAWHAVIYDLPREYALHAVAQHHRTTTDRCKAAHIVKLVKARLNDEIARAQAEEAARHQVTAPDRQLGGLPIGEADGHPVWSAYEQHGAIDLPCRTCGAKPDEACTNTQTGATRKLPCISRIIAGAKAAAA